MNDPFKAVREKTADFIIRLTKILGSEWTEGIILPELMKYII